MKKILGIIFFIFLMSINTCYAAKFDFLVIPTDLFVQDKEYLVFPKSANLISTDIINYYNQQPNMSATHINQVKKYLERPENFRLKKDVQKFLINYRDNYAIDFNMVQKLASIFKAKQVLLVTCNMDAQNYITRRTFWDFLDIPGATVIDPAYRLTTQVTLIDPNNQIILWHHNYQKLISSRENRIIPTTYNDAAEQMEKVNKYSTKFLAPQIVQETQLALLHLSPYQDLNLHPEIVKPDYVSIDKVKIDSKRGMVRSGRYIKKQSELAGAKVATETSKFVNTSKPKIKGFFNKIKTKISDVKNPSPETQLPVEEQIKLMQEKEQARFETLQAKQQLKYEKQLQKQQLNAAKRQMRQEMKLKLQEQKQTLEQKNIPADKQPNNTTVTPVNNNMTNYSDKQLIEKNSKNILNKIKNSKQNATQPVAPKMYGNQDLKSIPYIRTKTDFSEPDYTINDY